MEFLRKEKMPDDTEAAVDPENPEEQAAATDEQMVIDSNANAAATDSGIELNCLMRLTDDYLLMTTSKNNAMLFIEKMYKLSQVSNFKFNMRKLRTNFHLNL